MSLMLLLAHPSLGKGKLSEKQLDKHTNVTERSPNPQKYLEVKGQGLEEWGSQTSDLWKSVVLGQAFVHQG